MSVIGKTSRLLAFLGLACTPVVTLAEAVSVSPTRMTIPGAAPQGRFTVAAEGEGSSTVQIRVFSWREGRPASELRETRDVVVSPPIAKLRPRQEITVRVLRVATRRVKGRECYRLLVDKIPEQGSAQTVALRVRHSVPVCFAG